MSTRIIAGTPCVSKQEALASRIDEIRGLLTVPRTGKNHTGLVGIYQRCFRIPTMRSSKTNKQTVDGGIRTNVPNE